MPHAFGYRARTRDLFKKPFKTKGTIPLGKYLKTYKIGQIVDIVGDGAIHKGMPHKYYHGKTGVVWNVTPRALGVEVNKLVRGRIIKKRIHLRVEHVKHSTCRLDFLKRVQKNDKGLREAKKNKTKVVLKRIPDQPKAGRSVRGAETQTLYALKYTGLGI